MFLDLRVGNLIEPLTGRRWDRQAISHAILQRVAYYQDQGMRPSDRVLLLYGNRLEFFADLMAVWTLGGCAIPIDARLTSFEVGTLARAAGPRCAIGCDSDPRGAPSFARISCETAWNRQLPRPRSARFSR